MNNGLFRLILPPRCSPPAAEKECDSEEMLILLLALLLMREKCDFYLILALISIL